MTTIKTRVLNFLGFESLTAKGSRLTKEEVDDNWIGLLQRVYDLMPVGSIIPYLGDTATNGWLICDGTTTIGKASSNASFNDDKVQRLFYLLWNMCLNNPTSLLVYNNLGDVIDMEATFQTAESGWTSESYITLPDLREKTLIGYKSASVNNASLFKTGGNSEQDISHSHSNTLANASAPNHQHGLALNTAGAGNHTHTITTTIALAGDHTHNLPTHQHDVTPSAITVPEGPGQQAVGFPVGGKWTSTPANPIIATTGEHSHSASSTETEAPTHTHGISGNTGAAGGHTHSITGGVSNTNLIVETLPPYFTINWLVKYSFGV